MRTTGLAFTLLGTAAFAVSSDAQATRSVRQCSVAEATVVETEAATLAGWGQLHRSSRSDGPRCHRSRNVAKDRDFETFVLNHVDELISSEEARQIVVNAKTACPRNTQELCRKLELKAGTLGTPGTFGTLGTSGTTNSPVSDQPARGNGGQPARE